MNIEGLNPVSVGSNVGKSVGSNVGKSRITIPKPPAPKPSVDSDKSSDCDTVDVGEISNVGLGVAKGLVDGMEKMLDGANNGGTPINIADLKDISSMLKDVFVMIEKHDRQVGGSASRGAVDDGLALFMSRRKA